MATIATHNRSSVSRGHNLRVDSIVSKESHIIPNGHHETWVDVVPRKAYERLFGEAVREYNARQKRADRKIKNYYNAIREDQKKHTVYEMIIGVYPDATENVSPDVVKSILRDFTDGWRERNPNLELIGAYYHADEQGAPHVHIDYVPVAHGYKNGPRIQNGMVKALGEMGFEKSGKATAQILWEQRENQVLESLCLKRGIKVEHPQKDKGVAHVHTTLYKANKDLEQLKEKVSSKTDQVEQYHALAVAELEKYMDAASKCKVAAAELQELKDEYERLKAEPPVPKYVNVNEDSFNTLLRWFDKAMDWMGEEKRDEFFDKFIENDEFCSVWKAVYPRSRMRAVPLTPDGFGSIGSGRKL